MPERQDDLYDRLLDKFDEAEPSHGLDTDPVPTGWYHLEVERILDKPVSENGAAMVRLQLKVMEGEQENRRAFVTMVVWPSAVNYDGSVRSDTEIEEKNDKIQNQLQGFLKALSVNTGERAGEGVEKLYSYYNVDAWEGRAFLGNIKLQPARDRYAARNNLTNWYALDHPKHGLAWLRGQGTNGGSKPQTI